MAKVTRMYPDEELEALINGYLDRKFRRPYTPQVVADAAWTLLAEAAAAWDRLTEGAPLDESLEEFRDQADKAFRKHVGRFKGTPSA